MAGQYEFYSDVTATQIVEPVARSATLASAMVTNDTGAIAFLVHVGLWITDRTLDFKLQSSDTSDFANPVDVPATDFDGAVPQVNALTTDQADFLIRYTGAKSYLKLVGTLGGTVGSVVWGASVLKGHSKATSAPIYSNYRNI